MWLLITMEPLIELATCSVEGYRWIEFNLQLPQTKIAVSYAGERLNHINGTPRENFVPRVLVNLLDRRLSRFNDPILKIGYKTLNKLINAHPNKSGMKDGVKHRFLLTRQSHD